MKEGMRSTPKTANGDASHETGRSHARARAPAFFQATVL
jgi:hypothetical protein